MSNFYFLNCNLVKISDQHNLINFHQSFSVNRKESNEFIQIFETKIIKEKINLNTIQHLLSTIRKYCDYLRNISLITNEFIPSKKQFKIDWYVLRKEIIDCLILLDNILDNENISLDLKKFILHEFKNLLLSINRISNLPEHVFYELFTISSNKNGCNNQIFHFYLETWLNIYQLFKKLDSNLKEEIFLIRDNEFNGDLLNQFKFILLSDLILISLNKFNINRLDLNYRNSDPYICDCLKFVYLNLFSDYEKNLTENLFEHPFWLDFNKVLDFLKNKNFNHSENESIRHFSTYASLKNNFNNYSVLSYLWLILNLAQLFDHYFKENNSNKLLKENNIYVNSIIKNFIKEAENQENDTLLLNVLKISIKLSKVWTLNNETVLIFLDFFMKRLNNPVKNLKNLQVIPKTSSNWYDKLSNLSIIDENNIENEENVIQIFSFLLFSFVNKSIDDISVNNNFQKIKGRLYSKLQIKKIDELKELGLYNLLNTFLIILFVSKNHKSDLLTKYHYIIRAVKNKNTNVNKLPLILRSLFCANYFLIDNESISKSISLINEIFNEVTDLMPVWTSNNIQVCTIHNSYYEIVNVFFVELNEFFKNCETINPTFSNLLDCKFNVLFTKLSEREVISSIRFIKNLIQLVKFNLEENDNGSDLAFYNSLYQKIKKNFSEFLKNQIQSKSYDPEFSIVISELLHLICLMSNHEETFKNLSDSFLFAKYFDMLNLCDLLNYVIDNEAVFYKVIDVNANSNLELKILDQWFQIAVSTLLPNKQFNQLTKKLSLNFQLLKTSNEDLKSIEDISKNLIFHYKNLDNLNQMKFISEINQYLVETINLGKKLIKEEFLNEDLLTQFYFIISSLIENCSEIIYIQGNCNSILPQILEYFFNSNYIQSFSANKSQMINKCIKKYFSKIFIGLTKLHETNDLYIDRKLRFIFLTYVPMFLSKNSTHPLMIEMNQNEETSNKLFSLIFFYIKDCVFIKQNQNSTISIQLIQFIHELFIFLKNKDQKEKLFSLFPLILKKILTSDEITKRKLRDFLNLMFNEFKNYSEENFLKQLEDFYEEFITKNSENIVKVIRALDFIISICLPVKEKIVSVLMSNIKKIEDSPSGIDDHLRNTFRQFVNKIEN